MVAKLDLPFPYLSDPAREVLIGPLGLSDERDPRELALPALVIVGPEGEEVWRWVSRDYADRIDEESVLEVARALELGPVEPVSVRPGTPDPGPQAVDMGSLPAYFRGARFAVVAMRRRHPEIRDDGLEFIREMDRYLDALRLRRDRSTS